MRGIPARLRRLVIERARDRCEYCGLSQEGQEAAFHVDHVIPRGVGGPTSAENLALACVSCSLRKAARRTAVDPQTGEDTPLFHPRQDDWKQHFRWEGVRLVGLTASGRATIAALEMNRLLILAIRSEEAALGRPPSR
ncbi:MAG: HNH endonuclease [Luteitalea sp.]|nr:HNH endonuclease [Luteitalea sp.]